LAALGSFWPILTTQDLLPATPMVVVVVAWGAASCAGWIARRVDPVRPPRAAGAWVLAGARALEVALVLGIIPIRADGTRDEVERLDDAGRLTRPDDYVLDLKGESVFRHRSIPLVLEWITRQGLQQHRIPDTLIDDLIRTRTHVAIAEVKRFPPDDRRF